ncbi:ubiquitin-like autophagy protein Apg12-domain-containing protein [Lineolata rhizophorae]|uniref:Ubiquitin-like protein ATG12 n=1 Tax=Lineolata rhizophorae TaxID=578093 RepID=A0A6A6NQ22_9PEZI|nr:ubiquitin-like autophagy protein Apg12-domain-containing protein [Lineolata rhizophorae]
MTDPSASNPAGGAGPPDPAGASTSSPGPSTKKTASPSPSPPRPSSPSSSSSSNADLPLTTAASAVLTALPRDTRAALSSAGELGLPKVTVRLQPVGSAPALRQRVFKVGSGARFETVVRSLRRKLGARDHESVFCYVNSVFAPGLDEGVGNLWRCFKTKDELVVAYSVTPAFG